MSLKYIFLSLSLRDRVREKIQHVVKKFNLVTAHASVVKNATSVVCQRKKRREFERFVDLKVYIKSRIMDMDRTPDMNTILHGLQGAI